MKNNRDNSVQDTTLCGLFGMVDASAALNAAQRMYESNREGFRHCCDTRELISTEEAMARDARDAARRLRREDEDSQVEVVDYYQEPTIEVAAPIDDELTDEPIVDEDDRVIDLDDDELISDDSIEVLFDELALAD